MIAQRVEAVLAERMAQPVPAGLHLVATPIGNLADVTLRALCVIATADVVYCEDTRVSRRLLEHFGIARSLLAYHDHNGAAQRPHILAALAAGRSVALVSDAGSPLIADPGFKLVRAVAEAQHPVFAVPGPSALVAALGVSGLPTDRVLFSGFLPAKSAARRRALQDLTQQPETLVFFETAPRLPEALSDIFAVLGQRQVAVVRELTKHHERVLRGTSQEVARMLEALPAKGEIVLLVGGASPGEVADDAVIRTHLAAAVTLRPSEAVKTVAEALGVSRKKVYALFLEMREAGNDEEPGSDDSNA